MTHLKITSPVDSFLTDSEYSPSNAIPLCSLIYSAPAFSFAEKTAFDSGNLPTWAKGFAAKNAIGKDVVELLQDSFDNKHIHVRCVALANDTVGALLSWAYASGGCILGAILGTGTNGTYVEGLANITKLGNGPAATEGGQVIVEKMGRF